MVHTKGNGLLLHILGLDYMSEILAMLFFPVSGPYHINRLDLRCTEYLAYGHSIQE